MWSFRCNFSYCFCGVNVEDGHHCFVDAYCESLLNCSSSLDCPEEHSCGRKSCCGGNKCMKYCNDPNYPSDDHEGMTTTLVAINPYVTTTKSSNLVGIVVSVLIIIVILTVLYGRCQRRNSSTRSLANPSVQVMVYGINEQELAQYYREEIYNNESSVLGARRDSLSFADQFHGNTSLPNSEEWKHIDSNPDLCCSICMDTFDKEQLIAKLQCGHFFHKQCALQWLRRNPTCPLCRINVRKY